MLIFVAIKKIPIQIEWHQHNLFFRSTELSKKKKKKNPQLDGAIFRPRADQTQL